LIENTFTRSFEFLHNLKTGQANPTKPTKMPKSMLLTQKHCEDACRIARIQVTLARVLLSRLEKTRTRAVASVAFHHWALLGLSPRRLLRRKWNVTTYHVAVNFFKRKIERRAFQEWRRRLSVELQKKTSSSFPPPPGLVLVDESRRIR